MDDVATWLERSGLCKYVGVFAENEIELDLLVQLTDDDLREMGLPIGRPKRFRAALETFVVPGRHVAPSPFNPRGHSLARRNDASSRRCSTT
jgi:hypothetical protein